MASSRGRFTASPAARRNVASPGVPRLPAESQQAFFSRVYALVRMVPRGRVTTYGSIARALGVPRAARTVGWALRVCGADVPWHRVINAQGRISRRSTGGHRIQRMRLEREGVRLERDGRIDVRKYGWRRL